MTFQRNTPTANSIGEVVDTWTNCLTVWGSARPLSGGKYFAAKQANSEVSGEVEIRYRSDILPTMRMAIGTRILRIVSIINPDSRNERLIILYKEAED